MADPQIVKTAKSFHGGTPVDDLAILLMLAWGQADPRSNVSTYPASYVANFADMARAALNAGWRVPAPHGAGPDE